MPDRHIPLVMTTTAKNIEESVAFIRKQAPHAPDVGLILGSGLGDFADGLPRRTVIRASDIPHYPISTVEGHKGRIVFASLGEKRLVVFQGRIHFYESNSIDIVLYPIRVAQKLGAQTLIVTNAAGGVNRTFSPGDLMVITDQLNLTAETAGSGDQWTTGRRRLYDQALIQLILDIALREQIRVHKGVYAGVKGPSYETAAEVEMVHRIGGDAVGMSTVLEVECAATLGMRVAGISCITNKATGTGGGKLDHDEVRVVANKVRHDFAALLGTFIRSL